MQLLRAVALAVVLAAALVACSEAPERPPTEALAVRPVPSMQPDDVVDLRVYLRESTSSGAHLVAVSREVAIDAELPRRAVELLLAGPHADDPESLRAPLPTTTQLLGFHVEGATAHVDLSLDVVTEAHSVGRTALNELLALAALANTLTEFPEIDFVRLTVEGRREGRIGGVDIEDFWGGWGLPDVLVRDESVIGTQLEGEGPPGLQRFSPEPQRLGGEDAPAVAIRGVRAVERIGYLRLVIDLGDGQGEPAKAVPPVRALVEGERLVVQFDDVIDMAGDLAPGGRLPLHAGTFEAVEAAEGELPGAVQLAVVPAAGRTFWLHTLSSPTRVVLDVRK
jgi:hypothetical protein